MIGRRNEDKGKKLENLEKRRKKNQMITYVFNQIINKAHTKKNSF